MRQKCLRAESSNYQLIFATNDDNDATTRSSSATTATIRLVLDIMKDSSFIEEKHQEHVNNPSVTHLFKDTAVAALSDDLKLQFVNSWAGRALATVMQEEQDYLGDWKIQKILEAAGVYDTEATRLEIDETVAAHPIVMYSFVDCPWCLAAKALLLLRNDKNPNDDSTKSDVCVVVELESLGSKGKEVRAELAKQTGRTSMPCIFVNGQPIGGFTDGSPVGVGLQVLHETGELSKMIGR